MESTQVLDDYGVNDISVIDRNKIAVLTLENEAHDIYTGLNVIGRQESCDIVLDNKVISARHAIIEVEDSDSHVLYDLGSTNKTKLNDKVLKSGVRYFLSDNSKITFGSITGIYNYYVADITVVPPTVKKVPQNEEPIVIQSSPRSECSEVCIEGTPDSEDLESSRILNNPSPDFFISSCRKNESNSKPEDGNKVKKKLFDNEDFISEKDEEMAHNIVFNLVQNKKNRDCFAGDDPGGIKNEVNNEKNIILDTGPFENLKIPVEQCRKVDSETPQVFNSDIKGALVDQPSFSTPIEINKAKRSLEFQPNLSHMQDVGDLCVDEKKSEHVMGSPEPFCQDESSISELLTQPDPQFQSSLQPLPLCKDLESGINFNSPEIKNKVSGSSQDHPSDKQLGTKSLAQDVPIEVDPHSRQCNEESLFCQESISELDSQPTLIANTSRENQFIKGSSSVTTDDSMSELATQPYEFSKSFSKLCLTKSEKILPLTSPHIDGSIEDSVSEMLTQKVDDGEVKFRTPFSNLEPVENDCMISCEGPKCSRDLPVNVEVVLKSNETCGSDESITDLLTQPFTGICGSNALKNQDRKELKEVCESISEEKCNILDDESISEVATQPFFIKTNVLSCIVEENMDVSSVKETKEKDLDYSLSDLATQKLERNPAIKRSTLQIEIDESISDIATQPLRRRSPMESPKLKSDTNFELSDLATQRIQRDSVTLIDDAGLNISDLATQPVVRIASRQEKSGVMVSNSEIQSECLNLFSGKTSDQSLSELATQPIVTRLNSAETVVLEENSENSNLPQKAYKSLPHSRQDVELMSHVDLEGSISDLLTQSVPNHSMKSIHIEPDSAVSDIYMMNTIPFENTDSRFHENIYDVSTQPFHLNKTNVNRKEDFISHDVESFDKLEVQESTSAHCSASISESADPLSHHINPAQNSDSQSHNSLVSTEKREMFEQNTISSNVAAGGMALPSASEEIISDSVPESNFSCDSSVITTSHRRKITKLPSSDEDSNPPFSQAESVELSQVIGTRSTRVIFSDDDEETQDFMLINNLAIVSPVESAKGNSTALLTSVEGNNETDRNHQIIESELIDTVNENQEFPGPENISTNDPRNSRIDDINTADHFQKSSNTIESPVEAIAVNLPAEGEENSSATPKEDECSMDTGSPASNILTEPLDPINTIIPPSVSTRSFKKFRKCSSKVQIKTAGSGYSSEPNAAMNSDSDSPILPFNAQENPGSKLNTELSCESETSKASPSQPVDPTDTFSAELVNPGLASEQLQPNIENSSPAPLSNLDDILPQCSTIPCENDFNQDLIKITIGCTDDKQVNVRPLENSEIKAAMEVSSNSIHSDVGFHDKETPDECATLPKLISNDKSPNVFELHSAEIIALSTNTPELLSDNTFSIDFNLNSNDLSASVPLPDRVVPCSSTEDLDKQLSVTENPEHLPSNNDKSNSDKQTVEDADDPRPPEVIDEQLTSFNLGLSPNQDSTDNIVKSDSMQLSGINNEIQLMQSNNASVLAGSTPSNQISDVNCLNEDTSKEECEGLISGTSQKPSSLVPPQETDDKGVLVHSDIETSSAINSSYGMEISDEIPRSKNTTFKMTSDEGTSSDEVRNQIHCVTEEILDSRNASNEIRSLDNSSKVDIINGMSSGTSEISGSKNISDQVKSPNDSSFVPVQKNTIVAEPEEAEKKDSIVASLNFKDDVTSSISEDDSSTVIDSEPNKSFKMSQNNSNINTDNPEKSQKEISNNEISCMTNSYHLGSIDCSANNFTFSSDPTVLVKSDIKEDRSVYETEINSPVRIGELMSASSTSPFVERKGKKTLFRRKLKSDVPKIDQKPLDVEQKLADDAIPSCRSISSDEKSSPPSVDNCMKKSKADGDLIVAQSSGLGSNICVDNESSVNLACRPHGVTNEKKNLSNDICLSEPVVTLRRSNREGGLISSSGSQEGLENPHGHSEKTSIKVKGRKQKAAETEDSLSPREEKINGLHKLDKKPHISENSALPNSNDFSSCVVHSTVPSRVRRKIKDENVSLETNETNSNNRGDSQNSKGTVESDDTPESSENVTKSFGLGKRNRKPTKAFSESYSRKRFPSLTNDCSHSSPSKESEIPSLPIRKTRKRPVNPDDEGITKIAKLDHSGTANCETRSNESSSSALLIGTNTEDVSGQQGNNVPVTRKRGRPSKNSKSQMKNSKKIHSDTTEEIVQPRSISKLVPEVLSSIDSTTNIEVIRKSETKEVKSKSGLVSDDTSMSLRGRARRNAKRHSETVPSDIIADGDNSASLEGDSKLVVEQLSSKDIEANIEVIQKTEEVESKAGDETSEVTQRCIARRNVRRHSKTMPSDKIHDDDESVSHDGNSKSVAEDLSSMNSGTNTEVIHDTESKEVESKSGLVSDEKSKVTQRGRGRRNLTRHSKTIPSDIIDDEKSVSHKANSESVAGKFSSIEQTVKNANSGKAESQSDQISNIDAISKNIPKQERPRRNVRKRLANSPVGGLSKSQNGMQQEQEHTPAVSNPQTNSTKMTDSIEKISAASNQSYKGEPVRRRGISKPCSQLASKEDQSQPESQSSCSNSKRELRSSKNVIKPSTSQMSDSSENEPPRRRGRPKKTAENLKDACSSTDSGPLAESAPPDSKRKRNIRSTHIQVKSSPSPKKLQDNFSSDDEDLFLSPSSKQEKKGSLIVLSPDVLFKRKMSDSDRTSVSPNRRSHSQKLTKISGKEPDVKVMFTGYSDPKVSSIVEQLGGVIVDSPLSCTVLVTDKVRRTVKFLSAVAKGIPIARPEWLIDCKQHCQFIDMDDYILKDEEAELKFSFSLQQSLETSKKKSLLGGWMVYVTKSVKPPAGEMRVIIECSGGIWGGEVSSKSKGPWPKSQGVLITVADDKKDRPRKSSNLSLVTPEFILSGILQQIIDLSKYKIT